MKFHGRFYAGIALIVLSLVLGKLTTFTFFYFFSDKYWQVASVIIYILSWIPLFWGIWWVGAEYADSIQRYFSYKFYHHSVKKKTKVAINRGKNIHQKVKRKIIKKKLDKKKIKPQQ